MTVGLSSYNLTTNLKMNMYLNKIIMLRLTNAADHNTSRANVCISQIAALYGP